MPVHGDRRPVTAAVVVAGRRLAPLEVAGADLLARWPRRVLGDWVDGREHPSIVRHDGDLLLTARFLPGEPDVVELSCERDPLGDAALARLGLTSREAEVLRLVAGGAGNDEVALRLGTRPRTVQKHLEHVYAKLGVGTRTAAVAAATRA